MQEKTLRSIILEDWVMKKITMVFFLLGAVMFIVSSQALAVDWEYYSLNKDNNPLFYDKSRVLKSGHIVRVHQKESYSTNILYWLRQRMGEKYGNLKEAISLLEIDCAKAEYTLISFTHYDSDGKVIDTRSYERRPDWKAVEDSLDISILRDLCCFYEWKTVTASEIHDYFINRETIQVNNSNANITFWMKEVDKKTGKETEKEKVTIVCEKDKYTLRHLMKYNPDGSVKEVLTENHLRRWIPIAPKTIIDGFHDILCDDKYVRQNVKDYLKTVLK